VNATLASPRDSATVVADLILLRYALPNVTPKKVREDVARLLGSKLTGVAFDEMRSELSTTGLLARGRRNTFALTTEGRQRALHLLGLSALPPGLSWRGVVAKHLFPRAVGLSGEAAAKLENWDKMAAFTLKMKYGLSNGSGSTVKQVLEAIACRRLGFAQESTLDGLLCAVLSKLVGSDERLTKDQLAAQLPLFQTGLGKRSAEAARYSLVRDWLAIASTNDRPEPFDVAEFARTVRALAAASPPEDRFHDNKVFIAPLWRASQAEPNFPRLSLAEFKDRLIEANARHLLHLSRADLIQAMDPNLVMESETPYLNATFHFVLLEKAHL
jgi:hypothetical protein